MLRAGFCSLQAKIQGFSLNLSVETGTLISPTVISGSLCYLSMIFDLLCKILVVLSVTVLIGTGNHPKNNCL